MTKSSKRGAVLETAERLFEKQGYLATGINQITRDAEVAPMTLYNNFKNKDALILAVLQDSAERNLQDLHRQIETADPGPHRRTLAIFDSFDEWVDDHIEQRQGFVGCNFVRAALEFPDPDHPAHAAAARYKRALIQLFEDDLRETDCPHPQSRALDLHLLLEGAVIQAQLLSITGCVKRAKSMARALLEPGRE